MSYAHQRIRGVVYACLLGAFVLNGEAYRTIQSTAIIVAFFAVSNLFALIETKGMVSNLGLRKLRIKIESSVCEIATLSVMCIWAGFIDYTTRSFIFLVSFTILELILGLIGFYVTAKKEK